MKKIDFSEFIVDKDIVLSTEEQSLLAGIVSSKSIITKDSIQYYSVIAKSQAKSKNQFYKSI